MWDVGVGSINWGEGMLGRVSVWKWDGGEQEVDRYIEGWNERRWSFEVDGERWNKGVMEVVRRNTGDFFDHVENI